MRIISYNIRYNNPADGINAWPQRQERVTALLRHHQPDIFGLQEVRHEQLQTLTAALPDYGWLGVGRDDGAEAGEYAPLFYRRNRFTVQEQGYFWLSETPNVVGSFGWDAACVRIATWAKLNDQTQNHTLLVLNTHFDHRGMTAQLESAKLLHRFLADHASMIPAVVTGDFNCTPGSATYQALTRGGVGISLQDAMQSSTTPHNGPVATFTTDFADPLQAKIDYIFLHSPTDQPTLTVEQHTTLTDQADGRYPSDHLPIMAELTWRQQ